MMFFRRIVYKGNQTVRTLNTGIDFAGEGGMVWFKSRTHGWSSRIWDTVRGRSKYIYTADPAAELTDTAPDNQTSNMLASFDSNGVTLGKDQTNGGTNYGDDFANWQFRKAPGFFDVVTYTGNGTGGHQISHNLGSVPGCIMVKCTSESQDWMVYHVGTTDHAGPGGAYLTLNTTAAQYGSSGGFYNETATSTYFTLGDAVVGNKSGATYVAYIFAGGESTAATARSVKFDQQFIYSGASSDYTMGTGDFTVECWYRPNESGHVGLFQISDGANGLTTGNYENTIAVAHNATTWLTYGANAVNSSQNVIYTQPTIGTWYHAALVRNRETTKLYVNGVPVISYSDTTNYSGTTVHYWWLL